jgi:hypothetical protein
MVNKFQKKGINKMHLTYQISKGGGWGLRIILRGGMGQKTS